MSSGWAAPGQHGPPRWQLPRLREPALSPAGWGGGCAISGKGEESDDPCPMRMRWRHAVACGSFKARCCLPLHRLPAADGRAVRPRRVLSHGFRRDFRKPEDIFPCRGERWDREQLFLPGLRFHGFLEVHQSSGDDWRCRWRDGGPWLPGSGPIRFRAVETLLGRVRGGRRRALSAGQCGGEVRLIGDARECRGGCRRGPAPWRRARGPLANDPGRRGPCRGRPGCRARRWGWRGR